MVATIEKNFLPIQQESKSGLFLYSTLWNIRNTDFSERRKLLGLSLHDSQENQNLFITRAYASDSIKYGDEVSDAPDTYYEVKSQFLIVPNTQLRNFVIHSTTKTPILTKLLGEHSRIEQILGVLLLEEDIVNLYNLKQLKIIPEELTEIINKYSQKRKQNPSLDETLSSIKENTVLWYGDLA